MKFNMGIKGKILTGFVALGLLLFFSSVKSNHYQFTTSTIATSRVGGKTFAYNG